MDREMGGCAVSVSVELGFHLALRALRGGGIMSVGWRLMGPGGSADFTDSLRN